MADRLMFIGDTYSDIKGQATDETGVLDLSGASSLEMLAEGQEFQFSGTAYYIQPAEADADDIHHWNWGYVFAADDTAEADIYDIYLRVTWTTGKIETFGPATLQVKAAD